MNDLLKQDAEITASNPATRKHPRTQLATDLIATSARIHRLREQLRRAEDLRESQLAEMCARHGVGSDDCDPCNTTLPLGPDRTPSPAPAPIFPVCHADADWDGLS